MTWPAKIRVGPYWYTVARGAVDGRADLNHDALTIVVADHLHPDVAAAALLESVLFACFAADRTRAVANIDADAIDSAPPLLAPRLAGALADNPALGVFLLDPEGRGLPSSLRLGGHRFEVSDDPHVLAWYARNGAADAFGLTDS